MKNTLLLSFGLFLLVSNAFGQTPASASTEPDRILGARMDVAYSEDKTGASIRVTNISDKVIDRIYISSGSDNGARSMSILGGNIKPGGTSMLGMGINGRVFINLEAIVYADGSMEARNDAAIAEVKEQERLAREQHEKELGYARDFAVPNPTIHMPLEEQIVRNYYAKLSFLSQIAVVPRLISNLTVQVPPKLTEAEMHELLEDQVHFILSEFQVGDFSKIESSSWALLLNPDAPQGVIEVNSSSAGFGLTRRMDTLISYQAVLTPLEQQQNRREQIARDVRSTGISTVKDMVGLAAPGDWSRYAAFTVHAKLQGQDISYRALFLFAHNGETVRVFDPATRIPIQLNAPLYPTVLVESAYRELPFLKAWVDKNQLSGCKKFQEPEICCDPSTDRCGLASEDVARSLNLPLDERDRELLKLMLKPLPAPSPIPAKQAERPCPVKPESTGKK
ncbi:MAG TPA: hypothetical protein VGJ33_20245 [Candidatus Angelobacter sp.]|jgi:hypothetical protein